MIALFLLNPLFVDVAQAATTGSVRGHVEDDTGIEVPGAVVTLTGKDIAGELAAKTDDEGNFRFPSVPSGTHTLVVTMAGMAPLRTTVTVSIDGTVFVPVVMKLNSSEEIVVVAELPVVDTTRSSFSTELSAEMLQDLPTGRSYQDAVNMLPGISGRVNTQEGGSGDGNPSVRGEGQYGNNILVDGTSTRDPSTKTFAVNLPFEAIDDIQVYTDGAPAEFGEFTGMLVNVVTKDGGDEHFGSVYYGISTDASFKKTYLILDTETSEEVETPKAQFLSHDISLAAGGPIVKEKLWYFGGADFGYSTLTPEGTKPAEDGSVLSQQLTSIAAFGRLTWFITPDVSLSYKVAGDYNVIPNYNVGPLVSEAALSDYKSSSLSHLLQFKWRPDAFSEIDLKGMWWNSSIDVVPSSGDEEAPQIFNMDTGGYSGNHSDFDLNDRGRMGAMASVTRLLDGSTGHHKVKFGAEIWRLADQRELIYTGPEGGVKYVASPDSGLPCTAPDYADCYGYTEYSEVGPLGHHTDVFTTYLQDDWQPVDPVTMNIGVRVDREGIYQNAGDLFLDSWMFSPRLGMVWDVTRDSRTKLTANYGRYYDVVGNGFADWGDTRSAYSYRQYRFNPDTGGYDLVWVQDPAGNPATVDENLTPFHVDKFAVGFERELFRNFSVGARGILSKTLGLAEDIDVDADAFFIGNPDNKWRDYRAVEVTVQKKYADHWQLLASYTLSEAKGHTPGQFELSSGGSFGSDGNQVGVYLDDVNDMDAREGFFDSGMGWLLEGLAGLGTETDDAGYYGYLPYHSFHSVKVNGSYTLEIKKIDLTGGLIYELDSGHAWQKRGYVSLYDDYYAFPEGRGSRMMPVTNYVDLRLAGSYDLGNEREVELGIDIFNLLDLTAPINYYENEGASFGKVMYRQAPRSIRASVQFTY
ncbi:MAG TPA: TonB-dependent receptor [Myxococcota bacterium]|nr:TonB-dependent receptor [Myxococcota bacterium]